jgi:hypothetical protein
MSCAIHAERRPPGLRVSWPILDSNRNSYSCLVRFRVKCCSMKRWTAKAAMILFAALSIPMLVVAQTNGTGESDAHRTDKHNTQPSAGSKIIKFYIAEAAPNSGYETGPLHVIYSDGAHVIQELPPLKKSTAKETIFNAVGFSQVQLAADRQTLGWAIQVENCCTSYSLALSVVLFRSGRILRSISTGHMVWSWMFLQGGL